MVIADTGFWLALANRRDAYHENAIQALDALGDERLIVTWPVMTETCYLLLDRLGAAAQSRFLASHAAGAFEIAAPEIHPPDCLVPLLEKYEALPMGLADATLVLLAEWLGHGRILRRSARLRYLSMEEPSPVREPAAVGRAALESLGIRVPSSIKRLPRYPIVPATLMGRLATDSPSR